MSKLNLIFIFLIVVLLIILFNTCENSKRYQNNMEVLNMEIDTVRNKLGQQTAIIEVLNIKSSKSAKNIKTKDSTINRLKEIITDYKGQIDNAIIIENTTKEKDKSKTIIIRDTIIDTIREIYYTEWDKKWSRGWISANKDSITRSIEFNNKFEITIGEEKNGWFKPRTKKISVLNLNPNTYTNDLKSISITSKPKRFNLGFQIGYGVDLIGLKTIPYAGFGMSYTIIGIK